MNAETTEELKERMRELENRIETLEKAVGESELREVHRIHE